MGRHRRRGKSARKARKGQTGDDEEIYKSAPHSFIFHKGIVGRPVLELINNLRLMMEPYTAKDLKVRRSNVLKDFVNVAGLLHVTHFMIFTKSEDNLNLRVMRVPRGPTLSFRVLKYSLNKDVLSSLKKPSMEAKQFSHHPLLVMSGFSGTGMHFKLLSDVFQNMFPPINVMKVNLSIIRRCILINYNAENDTIELRHYNIKVIPVGMSRGVKKLIKSKIPNLGKMQDMSDLLLNGGDFSESEAELDGDFNQVVLPQKISGRGNIKSSKSAIRLTEIGPRLTMQLIKIEDGLGEGDILYHNIVTKTPKEIEEQKKTREKKRQLKLQRKKEQEANVKKKQEMKDKQKARSLGGMKRKHEDDEESLSDDDEAYYREEVGENPDPEFSMMKKKIQKKVRFNQSTKDNEKKESEKDEKKPKKKSGPKTILDEIMERKKRKKKKLKQKEKKLKMKTAMSKKYGSLKKGKAK